MIRTPHIKKKWFKHGLQETNKLKEEKLIKVETHIESGSYMYIGKFSPLELLHIIFQYP